MTAPSNLETSEQGSDNNLEAISPENSIAPIAGGAMGSRDLENEFLDELPDEVEMSLFDHLEELRQRLFYSLIAVAIAVVGCFFTVKPIVQLLEVPGTRQVSATSSRRVFLCFYRSSRIQRFAHRQSVYFLPDSDVCAAPV